MAEKKITRKVIGKNLPAGRQEAPVQEAEAPVEQTEAEAQKPTRVKKACFFDQSKTEPTYTDIATLRRYLSDRAKITPRSKSSVCSKHQRAIAKHIKYARHLGLLPFTPKV